MRSSERRSAVNLRWPSTDRSLRFVHGQSKKPTRRGRQGQRPRTTIRLAAKLARLGRPLIRQRRRFIPLRRLRFVIGWARVKSMLAVKTAVARKRRTFDALRSSLRTRRNLIAPNDASLRRLHMYQRLSVRSTAKTTQFQRIHASPAPPYVTDSRTATLGRDAGT